MSDKFDNLTKEMRETILSLAHKGYVYYKHIDNGKAIVSIKESKIYDSKEDSPICYAISFLDYDNYQKHFVTTIDPKKYIEEFYTAFKFQRKLDLAWNKTIKNYKKKQLGEK